MEHINQVPVRKFYRVREVAEMLGICRSLAYRLITDGTIPSIVIPGTRSRRVPAEALEVWLASQTPMTDMAQLHRTTFEAMSSHE